MTKNSNNPNVSIQKHLFTLQDKTYALFQSKLTPGIPVESIIGVRVPILRELAKKYLQNPEHKFFLMTLPHQYYDENMLHGLLVSQIKDFKQCLVAVENFLPYVDNWAVCDIMSPIVFKKNKSLLIDKIKQWISSDKTYTCRFGIGLLLNHFLDSDFDRCYLDILTSVSSDEYYVKMMLAWFFATALAKQWDATIPYLEQNRLGIWVHNKTIQKAIESYRITDSQKTYLRSLKSK